MAEIIAVANQKGGVGKSTTSINLADALTHLQNRVLVLDLDPQANTTLTYGAKIDDEYTIVDVLKKDCSASEAIQHTPMGDIIAGDPMLSGEKNFFNSQKARENILKRALKDIEDTYDFIIIDTPPDLDIYMLSALTAANGCVIPLNSAQFAIAGLSMLIDTINEVKEVLNEDLQIYGILLGKFDVRNSLDRKIREALPQIGKEKGIPIFDTVIRIDQNVQNVQAYVETDENNEIIVPNRSLYENHPRSNASLDFVHFTQELLEVIKHGKENK